MRGHQTEGLGVKSLGVEIPGVEGFGKGHTLWWVQ